MGEPRYSIEAYVGGRWHESVSSDDIRWLSDEYAYMRTIGDAPLRIFDNEAPGGGFCVLAQDWHTGGGE